MNRRVVRYSEAFKLQVVEDLESGRFGSPHEASQAYGITGMRTVRNWVEKYGRDHLLKKVVRVMKEGEPSELKRLKDRMRQLESTLADITMDLALERSFLEMLCEQTGTDGASFKKKHAGRLLSDRGSGWGARGA